MIVNEALVVQMFSGTQGQVVESIGLVTKGPVADVKCFYDVFPLVPLP